MMSKIFILSKYHEYVVSTNIKDLLICLRDAFVKHLGAKYFLLVQAYGAKCTKIL